MDSEDIHDVISTCRSYMIEQLQKDVADYLYEKNVFTREEYGDITRQSTREDQISCLLDKINNKGRKEFEIFLQYLLNWYSWITDAYMNCARSPDNNSLEELENILDEGEVPPLPLRSVKRQNEYMKLFNKLCNLKRNEYVVVYGMRGCGKSTLVTQVLRGSPNLALFYFKKKIFWLTIGRDCDELTVQRELCVKLSNRNYKVNLPLDSKSATRFLKERLRSEELAECLLILDDLSSSAFVEALDVNCKILITTDDKDIMNKTEKPVQYVRVSEGFTEEETLCLFSKSIGAEKLPSQAKNIHAICKGFPLTISLVSSQLAEFKEEVLQNKDLWDSYVSELKDEGISAAVGRHDRHRSEQVTLLYKAIGMSIDSLTEELKKYYQDMALFMNDVNIKPEVLCILWKVNKKEVLHMMSEFEKKCLVTKAWNRVKNSYIYCVHDLLLDYLKRQLTELEKRELHLRLVYSYQSKYSCDFNDFPVDDNYILLYLGYHLKEANLINEFPRVFLNLLFVEKKIMNYGVADLLLDYRKYKSLIANNGENAKKYEDFVYFINRVAACMCMSNSNIIQFGLCESRGSAVYKCAKDLAHSGVGSYSINKYFELLTEAPKEDSPPMVYYGSETIDVAIFVHDEDILVANESYEIRRINISSNHTMKKYSGHTGRITLLQLAKNLPYFLSASDDATVRIWCVNGHSVSQSSQFGYPEKPRTPSPVWRQINYCDTWAPLRYAGEPADVILEGHRVPIKYAQFSNSGFKVVSIADSEVMVWTLVLEHIGSDGKLTLCDHFRVPTDKNFESCSFSNDDRYIVCATSEGDIFIYNSINGDEKFSSSSGQVIKSMFIIPELTNMTAFILGERQFSLKTVGRERLTSADTEPNRRNQTYERKRKNHFICAAVSWNGQYVAIAAANNNIYIYDITAEKEVLKLNDCNGTIRSLCWSRQSNLLLTSYGTKMLKFWNVYNNGILNSAVKLRYSIFDAAWIIDQEIKDEGWLFTAVADSANKINIFYQFELHKVLDEPDNCIIHQICVCPTDGNVIYACKNGKVYLVELDSWKTQLILNVPCLQVCKLKTFSLDNRLLVVILVENVNGFWMLTSWSRESGNVINLFYKKQHNYEPRLDVVMDYTVDMNRNLLYVLENSHSLIIYCSTSAEIKRTIKLNVISGIEEQINYAKYCDISKNVSFVASGTDEKLYLLSMSDESVLTLDCKDLTPKMCKFSMDEKYFAVAFSNGSLNIYETSLFPKILAFHLGSSDSPRRATGPVIDIIWSLTKFRFIVIFDKEIFLYEITSTNRVVLLSVLYMSVDKLFCNYSFSESVTVDSGGHFRVLKHPS